MEQGWASGSSIAQGKEGVLSQHLLPKAESPTQGHSTAPI